MLGGDRQLGNIPKYIAKAKDKDDPSVSWASVIAYKNYDPRDHHPRDLPLVWRGRRNHFRAALRLEEIALKDPYFVEKKLYPNVDFYSGIIYRALGIPKSMYTVMFAIARTVGWVAHWREMIIDPDGRIGRPRQLYTGPTQRDYVEIGKR